MVTEQQNWGDAGNGSAMSLFTIENPFLKIQVTDLGAALTALICPDRNGHSENVVVGATSPEVYRENPSYLGATVGRFANRIGGGRFWLDGKEYALATNNGPNHLHGGLCGLSRHRWEATQGEDAVTFRTISPDGEDGYPGNLDISVTYRLSNHILSIDYIARTDAPTVVNLTNHTYWNLSNSQDVLGHHLELFSDAYLETDSNVLPTGTILDVANSPFDFRSPTQLKDPVANTNGGFDHCFVVRGWDGTLRLVGRAADMDSGRVMEVHTTVPGIQLYTANHFDGSPECGGRQRHEALCLECQHFPDSPNQLEFPSTALRPGEEYRQTTEYRFFTAR
ncbi:MAG TPA: aldose epimerase family protein [Planctomicrobium sp.]|nr:aldose epimerase family protein [Planctomicrobium sp.]